MMFFNLQEYINFGLPRLAFFLILFFLPSLIWLWIRACVSIYVGTMCTTIIQFNWL